jgi:hypothetical protein
MSLEPRPTRFRLRQPLICEILLAPPALIALFLVTFNMFIFGDRNMSTFPDNTYLLQPIFHHLSESFRRGEYPYWMNTIFGGLPLYKSPQFSAEYPFYFFRFGLYASPLGALVDGRHVMLLHFFILYGNTYLMLRIFRLAPVAALLGASLFAFGPGVVLYGWWINILAPYSWLPLIAASVFMVLENTRAEAGVLLGIISISLLGLASPAQPLIHTVVTVSVLYAFYAVHYVRRRQMRLLWRVTGNLSVIAVAAFAISSPSIVPAFLSIKDTIRFIGDFPNVVGDAKMPFDATLVGQLRPGALAAAVLPLRVSPVIGHPFMGPGAVFFALFGLLKMRTNRIVLPLAALALYGLLSASGSHLGLAQLNYHLPLLNKIREPGRHLILFNFGVATLAAFGLAHWMDALKGGYRTLQDQRHLAAGVVYAGILLAVLNSGLTYVGLISKTQLLGLVGLSVACVLLLRFAAGWKQTVVAGAAALSVIYANLQFPLTPPRWADGDYFTAANLVSHKALGELASIEDIRNYRVLFGDDKLGAHYLSMNASYYGLRSFTGYMNPLPKAQFESAFQRSGVRNYYPLLGAKYYLCNPCDPGLLRDYAYVKDIQGYRLHVDREALPHYTVMYHAMGSYQTDGEFLARIDAGYDYAKEFFVPADEFERVRKWLGPQPSSASYVLKVEDESLNRIRVSVNTEAPAVLVLNEVFDDAWKAAVNGLASRPIRVNSNQIGVLLEKGANLIEFEYSPVLFIRLLWLQRGVVLCLVLYVIWRVTKVKVTHMDVPKN